MAIDRENGVRRVSVAEILEEDLSIPPYQRPYSWEPLTAVLLLDDILDAYRRGTIGPGTGINAAVTYVLGTIILHRDDLGGTLNIVDGQQRLLTLTMLLDILDEKSGVSSATGHEDHEDKASPVVAARSRLASRVQYLDVPAEALARFTRDNCHLIRVETNDPDEAFRVFDSQNYRGKALLPHDLLKAYHLREMREETNAMKAAVVETWESAADADLDRLFSVYLWRVKQWSRGLSAPPFAPRHVGAFKGISVRTADTPVARYHLAAQAAIPMLASWQAPSAQAEGAVARSRFQIDAPIHAGRPFFEMVTFMLAELERLRGKGYSGDGWDAFASSDIHLREVPSKSQYRYVSALYLAALLYYTNKFGETDLPEARHILFRWAYSLRTRLQRVQMVSINNHAKDPAENKSAFLLLRNADSPRELHRLAVEITGRTQDPGHMEDLRAFLDGLEGS